MKHSNVIEINHDIYKIQDTVQIIGQGPSSIIRLLNSKLSIGTLSTHYFRLV